jgi:preprotein translocase subunit SecF
MFVVKYRTLFFILSALLVAVSIAAMFIFGFRFGIDFKGGTITQISYAKDRPAQQEMSSAINSLNYPSFGDTVIQPTGVKSYIIRSRELSEAEKEGFLSALAFNGAHGSTTIERYDSIGPVVGEELKNKSYTAIGLVILCIVIFITYAFRKVSEPVASWKYGLATIVALAHDVIIPTGLFIIYIHYKGGEIDVLFVSAILAILGYSVHDTIVVFDRVREHLRLNRETNVKREPFETTVGKSVSETFGRSINTSLTIFLVLLVLYFVGGSTTKDFSLILLIGVIVGTYSSIFVASPLLVTLEKMQSGK